MNLKHLQTLIVNQYLEKSKQNLNDDDIYWEEVGDNSVYLIVDDIDVGITIKGNKVLFAEGEPSFEEVDSSNIDRILELTGKIADDSLAEEAYNEYQVSGVTFCSKDKSLVKQTFTDIINLLEKRGMKIISKMQ